MRYLNFSKSIVKFNKRIFTKKSTNLIRTKEMLKFEVSISAFSNKKKKFQMKNQYDSKK